MSEEPKSNMKSKIKTPIRKFKAIKTSCVLKVKKFMAFFIRLTLAPFYLFVALIKKGIIEGPPYIMRLMSKAVYKLKYFLFKDSCFQSKTRKEEKEEKKVEYIDDGDGDGDGDGCDKCSNYSANDHGCKISKDFKKTKKEATQVDEDEEDHPAAKNSKLELMVNKFKGLPKLPMIVFKKVMSYKSAKAKSVLKDIILIITYINYKILAIISEVSNHINAKLKKTTGTKGFHQKQIVKIKPNKVPLIIPKIFSRNSEGDDISYRSADLSKGECYQCPVQVTSSPTAKAAPTIELTRTVEHFNRDKPAASLSNLHSSRNSQFGTNYTSAEMSPSAFRDEIVPIEIRHSVSSHSYVDDYFTSFDAVDEE
jgi:hypothetical protein